jgi:nucleoside-diphosphate-sugar epimerase
MKLILISGQKSYIGTSLEKWLNKNPEKYSVDTIDMIGEEWKEKKFSKYDVVFHVAGIAHIKETKENQELYYKVNRDLTWETAKKAKQEGVKQFIFLSSMSVYGVEEGAIDINTALNPNTNYGKSKLQAEELIRPLNDNLFKVAILRPPMVYGKGCKGNYPKLSKIATKLPVFPKLNNKRSMIYIDNLCEFVKILIDDYAHGLFFPQNKEYVNISEMVKIIAEANGKKILMTSLFNPLLNILKIDLVQKAFSELIYEKSMSEYENDYRVCDLKESIFLTEGARK